MGWHLFLDESGDLGFDFQNKESSKFLTITVLAVSQQPCVTAIRCAVKKTLRRKINVRKHGKKQPETELKGANTSLEVKKYFYNLISDVKFGLYSITLNKRRVYNELCDTPQNKDRLYNFVANKVISQIPFESALAPVDLVVDRSKGKKGIADFNEYIVWQLQSRLDPRACLRIHHAVSDSDGGLSAVDLFCWGIFRNRESSDSTWRDLYASKILVDEQYL